MNEKYLYLTDDQIAAIKSKFPSWDDDSVEYKVKLTGYSDSFDHEFGTEYVFTTIIDELDIVVPFTAGKNNATILKESVNIIKYILDFESDWFKLTDEQYDEIVRKNKNDSF